MYSSAGASHHQSGPAAFLAEFPPETEHHHSTFPAAGGGRVSSGPSALGDTELCWGRGLVAASRCSVKVQERADEVH